MVWFIIHIEENIMPSEFFRLMNEAISNILIEDERDISEKSNGLNSQSRKYQTDRSDTVTLKKRLQEKYHPLPAVNDTMLDRANKNVSEFDEDLTLHEMEYEHNHAEQNMPIDENWDNICLLGETEDLIIKGYNGSIPYERDFVREAEEFLSKISVI